MPTPIPEFYHNSYPQYPGQHLAHSHSLNGLYSQHENVVNPKSWQNLDTAVTHVYNTTKLVDNYKKMQASLQTTEHISNKIQKDSEPIRTEVYETPAHAPLQNQETQHTTTSALPIDHERIHQINKTQTTHSYGQGKTTPIQTYSLVRQNSKPKPVKPKYVKQKEAQFIPNNLEAVAESINAEDEVVETPKGINKTENNLTQTSYMDDQPHHENPNPESLSELDREIADIFQHFKEDKFKEITPQEIKTAYKQLNDFQIDSSKKDQILDALIKKAQLNLKEANHESNVLTLIQKLIKQKIRRAASIHNNQFQKFFRTSTATYDTHIDKLRANIRGPKTGGFFKQMMEDIF